MGKLTTWLYCLVLVASQLVPHKLAGQDASTAEFFEAKVVPILLSHCLECHNREERSGGLALDGKPDFIKGGESGSFHEQLVPVDNLLWMKVVDGEMPPPRQGKPQPLSSSEKEILNEWIRAGMPWPEGRTLDPFERTTQTRAGRDWWSLQPREVVTPPRPDTSDPSDVSNYIDAFVLEKLQAQGWQMASVANRADLLRRLYWDVVGLAPSDTELRDFEQDTAPDAYSRRVEQLLASPQFGVRWGRYWLDLVRYADTSGYERDQEKQFAWKYRDWVVRALNEDLPYDQFVRWQLAGDEVALAKSKDLLTDEVVATGFLRLGTWNDEPNDPADYVYERLEDLIHATSSAFIGLTIKCARCHDHKFDPISQADYYRLGAAFWPGPIAARNRDWLGGPSPTELPGNVLGWTDLSADAPILRRLRKGETNQPLEEVPAGTMSFVPALYKDFAPPPEKTKTTLRRSQLADWLLDSSHPLTSRVIVNRLWQFHFGNGLVRSANNWGFTGETPSHPELLDFLAERLIGSGWSLKRLHREILLSRTYQQSTRHPQSTLYEAKDAANRLLWRANSRRTDAESLRDRLLQAAGNLDLRISGPGFRPPLAKDVLDGLSMKSKAWVPSSLEEQSRRSLYLFSQRSLSVPLMNTFDACDSSQPCAQREVTTVAPQALAMLNNQMIVQPCEQLANQVVARSDSLQSRLEQIWRSVMLREPTGIELQQSAVFVKRQQKLFDSQILAYQNGLADSGTERKPHRVFEFIANKDNVSLTSSLDVESWRDATDDEFFLASPANENRPVYRDRGDRELSHLMFDGNQRYLVLNGSPIQSDGFTIMAVIRDRDDTGHRQIFSNWNGSAGNSVTSFFLGLTGEGRVRVSDDFTTQKILGPRHSWHVLAAVVSSEDVKVFVDGELLEQLGRGLSPRNYSGSYVIGQQGNIQGEYWNGDIAALSLFAEALPDEDMKKVMQPWCQRIGVEVKRESYNAEVLALASLIQVMVSSNEFLYID